mgnify:CR=1 FL=1
MYCWNKIFPLVLCGKKEYLLASVELKVKTAFYIDILTC